MRLPHRECNARLKRKSHPKKPNENNEKIGGSCNCVGIIEILIEKFKCHIQKILISNERWPGKRQLYTPQHACLKALNDTVSA